MPSRWSTAATGNDETLGPRASNVDTVSLKYVCWASPYESSLLVIDSTPGRGVHGLGILSKPVQQALLCVCRMHEVAAGHSVHHRRCALLPMHLTLTQSLSRAVERASYDQRPTLQAVSTSPRYPSPVTLFEPSRCISNTYRASRAGSSGLCKHERCWRAGAI
jgi:hypothetical protein